MRYPTATLASSGRAVAWPSNTALIAAPGIDSQYRGEVKVLLFNHSDGEHFIKQGDRIAQLLVQKVETVEFLPVDNLDDTDRSGNGFGSTGPA